MTVAAVNAYSGPYSGNGATTAFAFTFKALSDAEVGVLVDGVAQVSGFTVTRNANGNGGTVTFATPPASGAEVIPISNPAFTQDIAFAEGGPFLAQTTDEANDRAAVRAIFLKGKVDRALTVPVGETGSILPDLEDRKGKLLVFDADGNAAVTISQGGADETLRAELAENNGAKLVGTTDGVSVDSRLITLAAALANGTVSALVGTRIYATKALLDADLAHNAGTFALVYDDPSGPLNDLYVKVGASGAGSWDSAGIFGRAIEALELPTVTTLPLDPFGGQRIVWGPTSETASYDKDQRTWLRADGTPLAVVHETFTGAAATQLDTKLLEFTRDPVQASSGDVGTFSKLNDGEFELDGSGRLKTKTLDADALATMNVVPARCVEREFMFGVLPNAGGTGHAAGIYLNVDGFTGLRFSVHEVDRGMRLRQIDAVANTTTDLQTAFIPVGSWTSTTVQRFWARYWYDTVAGTYKCTVRHLGALGSPNLASPTEVAVDVPSAIKPASMAGVYANGANARLDYFHIYPLDDKVGIELDEGLHFEGLRTIDEIHDNDAISVADITGNGLPDLLLCASTNGNGVPAGAYWYEQYAPGKFYKHTIDQNANVSTEDKFSKIEGCTWWDIGDGVPGALIVDQTLGKLFLYRPVSPEKPQGTWKRVEFTGYAKGQDCFTEDIDGDGREELIFAHEGTTAGTGGVVWLDWTFGSDPMNAASYQAHVIVQREGAWSFLKRAKFIWTAGQQALIFSARDHWNLGQTAPGIYAAIRPAVVTDPWTLKTLFQGADGREFCWIDLGNFSGNGNGLDIVYGVEFETPIRYLEFPNAAADPFAAGALPWTSVQIADPGGTRQNWNVMALEINGMARTAVTTCQDSYGVVLYQYVAGAWKETLLVKFDYSHPSEKPNVPLLDLYGDGRLLQIHADSGGHRAMALTFRRDAG